MEIAKWLTPPQIAKMLGVTNTKVLNWIASGKLKAANLSDGMSRARWKIDPINLALFLDGKSNHVASTPERTRRRVIPKPTRQWV